MLRPAKLVLLLGTLLGLAGCTVYREHPVKLVDDATGGAGFEQAFWRDIKEHNWKDLERHIAANFVYISPAGRLERAAAIQQLESIQVLEYSIGNLETEMNGNTFVVTYTIVLRENAGPGERFPEQPQRRMTVWQQQKSGWVAIAHSLLGVENK